MGLPLTWDPLWEDFLKQRGRPLVLSPLLSLFVSPQSRFRSWLRGEVTSAFQRTRGRKFFCINSGVGPRGIHLIPIALFHPTEEDWGEMEKARGNISLFPECPDALFLLFFLDCPKAAHQAVVTPISQFPQTPSDWSWDSMLSLFPATAAYWEDFLHRIQSLQGGGTSLPDADRYLEKVSSFGEKISPEEPFLICPMGSRGPAVKPFLRYYARLGVKHYFIVIDGNTDTETRNQVKEFFRENPTLHPLIHEIPEQSLRLLWYTTAPFYSPALAGKWAVCVDSDEFLLTRRPLPEVIQDPRVSSPGYLRADFVYGYPSHGVKAPFDPGSSEYRASSSYPFHLWPQPGNALSKPFPQKFPLRRVNGGRTAPVVSNHVCLEAIPVVEAKPLLKAPLLHIKTDLGYIYQYSIHSAEGIFKKFCGNHRDCFQYLPQDVSGFHEKVVETFHSLPPFSLEALEAEGYWAP